MRCCCCLFDDITRTIRRKAREKDEAFAEFQSQTGIFPFAAIVFGKTRLEVSEIKWPFVAVALAAYVVAILLH